MKQWMEWNVSRRLLAMALCLCMVLSLLPSSALAEEADVPETTVLESSEPESSEPDSSEPESPEPEEGGDRIITSWQWVDEKMLDEETGNLALPGACEDMPAFFEDVVALLPGQITAAVEEGECTLSVTWACEEYPEEGAYAGEYTFTASLPQGYRLAQGVRPLTVKVLLGGVKEEPAQAVMISAWAWVDEEEVLDEETGNLALPGASEDMPAFFEDVVALLPVEITAALEEGEVTLSVTWACEEYPEEGAYAGEYTFTASLPQGYRLAQGVRPLTVDVLLGGGQVYATTYKNVPYLDYDADTKSWSTKYHDAQEIVGAAITDGWYVVKGEKRLQVGNGGAARFNVSGDAYLILEDDCVFTAAAFTLNPGSHLTIYAQSTGEHMGKMSNDVSFSVNRLTAGIGCSGTTGTGNSPTLVINGGNITAIGRNEGSGIGGVGSVSIGSITINGGIINATGDGYGAGIGGHTLKPANIPIVINGGTIKAIGGSSGPGIGGSTGCSVTITGGTVYAEGGKISAGIGGAYTAENVNVTITGGNVTADGGKVVDGVVTTGAGIGQGPYGKGGEVKITDGTVIATGGDRSAGIGGSEACSGGTVTITGGHVTATGGDGGAGIGAGLAYSQDSSFGSVTISGGTVIAEGGSFVGIQSHLFGAAGIGSGTYNEKEGSFTSSVGSITISGGNVQATGASGGAGIGTGVKGSVNSISISGDVIATGSTQTIEDSVYGGAGIGSGAKGSVSGITISGGSTIATPGTNACAIGAGVEGTGGSIVLIGGVTYAKGIIGKGNYGKSATVTTVKQFVVPGAVIIADGIQVDTGGKNLKNCIYFEKGAGKVYGSPNLVYPGLAIPAGLSLTLDMQGNTVYGVGTVDLSSGSTLKITGPGGFASLTPKGCKYVDFLAPGWGLQLTSGLWADLTQPKLQNVRVVQGPISIVTQPQNATLTYGNTVTLTAAASHAFGKTLTYTWYYSTDSGKTWVKSGTGASLTLGHTAPTGKYFCQVTDGTYTLDTNTVTVTLQKITPTISITADLSKTYDGSAASLSSSGCTISANNLTLSPVIEYKVQGAADSTYQAAAPIDAGSYTVRVRVEAGTYTNAASATRNFTISQKRITISGVKAANKTYDGTTNAVISDTGTLPIYTRDEGKVSIVPGTASFESGNVGSGKKVTFSGFSLDDKSGNYILASQPADTTADITPKELTVDVKIADKEFDGTTDAVFDGEPSLVGVVTGDDVTLEPGTPSFTSAAVGTDIPVTISGMGVTGTDSGNYTLSQPTGLRASIFRTFTAVSGTDFTASSSDWINTDFRVSAGDGRKLSTDKVTWSDSLTVTAEGVGTLTFYVLDESDGAVSRSVELGYKIDKTAPTGAISLDGKAVTEADGTAYKNGGVAVVITGSDSLSGIGSLSYCVSDQAPESVTDWTDGSSFTLTGADGDSRYVCVKVTDKAGNTAYLRSCQVLFDLTAPVITGVANGTTCYTTQTAAAADENLLSVTLNGKAVSSPVTLTGNTDAVYTIIATDKAGNQTTCTVTMKTILSLYEDVKDITPENVAKSDQGKLEDARSALEELPESPVDSENQEIQEAMEAINDALEALENARKLQEQIDALPGTVAPDDTDTEQRIKDVREEFEKLTDHEKELVDTTKLEALEKALVDYKITQGDGSVWSKGDHQGLIFKANGPVSKFQSVKVDGAVVTGCTVTSGSTIVTLEYPFLQTLALGGHTLQVFYTDGQTGVVSFTVQMSPNYLDLQGNEEFEGLEEVWVDGERYPVEPEGGAHVRLPETGDLLTVYTYAQGSPSASCQNYPTGMKVYLIERTADGADLSHLPELDDLLRYAGCSIRVTGVQGVRMITALTKDNKKALTTTGLAGFTLAEYGTVVQWASSLNGESLTLASGRHNYAYKKGAADPVFATSGELTMYTNVLVGFSMAQCSEDIVMRSYIILKDPQGNPVTLYGGPVTRSTGYIAYQNYNTFQPGTKAYQYVWDIIHSVYGDQYDDLYQG